MTLRSNLDTKTLNSRVDLRDLFGGRAVLRNETGGGREKSGPCPKCGGDDRLHVTADWFMCRQCHAKRGDAIDAVQWLGLAPDFLSACAYLGGAAVASPSSSSVTRVAPEKRRSASWQDAKWQADARATLTRAQAALASPDGEPGREYLAARGLTPETWRAWGLGYTGAAWDPKLQAKRHAIVIPWRGKQVTAIKYRFLTVPDDGLRYSSKGGGQCLAFGLGLTGEHFVTLWLVEGEFNAMSIWQTFRATHRVNADVVSFGSESSALNPTVTKWAARYRQVIVWTDKPDRAKEAMAAIPGAFGLRSSVLDGVKADANELLKMGGLAGFMRAAEDRFDEDPDYFAKCLGVGGFAEAGYGGASHEH